MINLLFPEGQSILKCHREAIHSWNCTVFTLPNKCLLHGTLYLQAKNGAPHVVVAIPECQQRAQTCTHGPQRSTGHPEWCLIHDPWCWKSIPVPHS